MKKLLFLFAILSLCVSAALTATPLSADAARDNCVDDGHTYCPPPYR